MKAGRRCTLRHHGTCTRSHKRCWKRMTETSSLRQKLTGVRPPTILPATQSVMRPYFCSSIWGIRHGQCIGNKSPLSLIALQQGLGCIRSRADFGFDAHVTSGLSCKAWILLRILISIFPRYSSTCFPFNDLLWFRA
jgi:hypothetical protein